MIAPRRDYQNNEIEQLDLIYRELCKLYTNLSFSGGGGDCCGWQGTLDEDPDLTKDNISSLNDFELKIKMDGSENAGLTLNEKSGDIHYFRLGKDGGKNFEIVYDKGLDAYALRLNNTDIDNTAPYIYGENIDGEIVKLDLNLINNYEEISHEDLLTLKNNNELKKGKFYAIDDFKTVYDQPDFESDGTPKTSVVTKIADDFETLVLLATSNNSFAEQVWSVEYPNDKLKYDIDFVITEVMGQPAKGRITYREDNNGNSVDYDFRTVLLKRYESLTGSGIFNQWADNGEASQEFLTFGNNYGTAIIKGNVIGGIRGLGNILSYPFLICNVVINAENLALGNNINVISRNCHFGDGLIGTDLNSAVDVIVGTDMRNFKNTGNIVKFRAGNNTNTITFLSATDNVSIGNNNSNIHFKHSVGNVHIGNDNNNWECDSEIQNLTSDNELSNINNLYISNYINGGSWVDFITPITHPEMYNNTFKKEIILSSNVYADDICFVLWYDSILGYQNNPIT